MKRSEAVLHLKSVNAAIRKLEADPSVSVSVSTPGGGSRSFSFQSLDTLYKERDRLERQIEASQAPMGYTLTGVRFR